MVPSDVTNAVKVFTELFTPLNVMFAPVAFIVVTFKLFAITVPVPLLESVEIAPVAVKLTLPKVLILLIATAPLLLKEIFPVPVAFADAFKLAKLT